jgi:serine protease Do
MENTPAQKAGFKAGDVVTKVDGNAVSSPSELSGAVRTASSKKTYAVELMRDHKAQTLNVAVEEGRSERPVPRGRIVHNVN